MMQDWFWFNYRELTFFGSTVFYANGTDGQEQKVLIFEIFIVELGNMQKPVMFFEKRSKKEKHPKVNLSIRESQFANVKFYHINLSNFLLQKKFRKNCRLSDF